MTRRGCEGLAWPLVATLCAMGLLIGCSGASKNDARDSAGDAGADGGVVLDETTGDVTGGPCSDGDPDTPCATGTGDSGDDPACTDGDPVTLCPDAALVDTGDEDGGVNDDGLVDDGPELHGVGTDNDFDVAANPADGVGVDEDGALVVDRTRGTVGQFIWVADTGGANIADANAGVYKIDMETLEVVGHYAVGGTSPSRTTVNALGEAFVGAREAPFGVTKILPGDCPDRNGNGMIDTSTGLGDVLPYLMDECVAWYTPTNSDVRGLAAQDISGLSVNACEGYDPNTMEFAVDPNETPDQHYVWVSSYEGDRLWKLDSETGQILIDLDWPVGEAGYGLALAGDGKIWTAKHVTFLDTLQCTDQATCTAAPFCDFDCQVGNCPDLCDGAVKGKFPTDNHAYGVTVDCKQRVWYNYQDNGGNGATYRLDPSLPPAERLAAAPNAAGDGGIAADNAGWVWVGFHLADRMWRVDAEQMISQEVPIRGKGVAVRPTDGHVLAVEHQNGGPVYINEIEPGATIADANIITPQVQYLPDNVYAYSDMNGVQTQLASSEPSWYRQIFEGCADGPTRWQDFAWDVEVPEDTWVMIKLRSAETMQDLDGAEWSTIACHVADSKDAAIIDYVGGEYIEVELRFTAAAGSGCGGAGEARSARVLSFGPSRACEPEVFGPG